VTVTYQSARHLRRPRVWTVVSFAVIYAMLLALNNMKMGME